MLALMFFAGIPLCEPIRHVPGVGARGHDRRGGQLGADAEGGQGAPRGDRQDGLRHSQGYEHR